MEKILKDYLEKRLWENISDEDIHELEQVIYKHLESKGKICNW